MSAADVHTAATALRHAAEQVFRAHTCLRDAGEDALALKVEETAGALDCTLADVAKRYGALIGEAAAREARDGETDVVSLEKRRVR